MKVGPRALLIAKFVFSIALVAAVLSRVVFADVLANLATVKPGYVLVCLFIAVPTIAASAWRWQMLAQGILSFRAAVKYILIGMFYGALLPSAVSADIARGVALAAKDKSKRLVALPASILVDRLLGLAALSCLSTVGFLIVVGHAYAELADYESMALIGAELSIGLAAVSLFPFTPWFERTVRAALPWVPYIHLRTAIERVAAAVVPYATMPGVIVRAFGLSVFIHALTLVGYMVAFRAFDIHVGLLTVTIYFSCLSIILLLPISISGLGVRDVFSVFFFGILHASAGQAVAFSWLLFFLGLTVALVGAGVQIWELHRPSNFLGRDS